MQIIVRTLAFSLLRKGQLSKVDSVLLQNRHRLKHPQKAKYFHVDLCPRMFQRQPLDIFWGKFWTTKFCLLYLGPFSKSFWNMTQEFTEPRFNCFWVGEIGAKVMKFTFTNKFYGWACNSDDSLFTMKPPSIYEYSWDPLKLMCLHGNFKFKGLFELFVTAFKHPSSCSTDCVLIHPMFWIW